MSGFVEFVNNKIKNTNKIAWSHEKSVDCAKYFLLGKPLQSEELAEANKKLKAFFKAFAATHADNNDFSGFVPESFANKYAAIYSHACEEVVKNHSKPANYDFLVQLDILLDKISKQRLNVSEEFDLTVNINKQKCFHKSEPYVRYNLFGAVTGRLTTQKNSFPILTMSKDCRFLLSPTNDAFLELDYNACELRVLLALNEHKQPDIDLHDWNREHIFENKFDRKESKQKIFSWLYDTKVNEQADKYYNKTKTKEKYYKNGLVTNYYDRKIECDEQHALNYIIQSTASDMFLRRVLEIDKLLENRKSKVAFMIHDSLVIDLSKEDRDLLDDIEKTFSNTELGLFKTNVSIGKDFGNMRKIK